MLRLLNEADPVSLLGIVTTIVAVIATYLVRLLCQTVVCVLLSFST
jgi:hypothetical protein